MAWTPLDTAGHLCGLGRVEGLLQDTCGHLCGLGRVDGLCGLGRVDGPPPLPLHLHPLRPSSTPTNPIRICFHFCEFPEAFFFCVANALPKHPCVRLEIVIPATQPCVLHIVGRIFAPRVGVEAKRHRGAFGVQDRGRVRVLHGLWSNGIGHIRIDLAFCVCVSLSLSLSLYLSLSLSN